ncbi:hypothetical protein [Flexithrix dorotheae]|uniref:hypothetical protein n=1 Tax=Flexithrix dorotheae TaxID=70993 RepID=UPI0012F8C8A6|nr:hypothetical protein [Flexithrix dorotheae]
MMKTLLDVLFDIIKPEELAKYKQITVLSTNLESLEDYFYYLSKKVQCFGGKKRYQTGLVLFILSVLSIVPITGDFIPYFAFEVLEHFRITFGTLILIPILLLYSPKY